MAELKRCPFCGQLPTTEVIPSSFENNLLFTVVCTKCKTAKSVRSKIDMCTFLDIEKAMEEATKAWNTRWEDE